MPSFRIFDRAAWRSQTVRRVGLAAGVVGLLAASAIVYYYVRFSRMIDGLEGPVFVNVSQVYSAPRIVEVGETASPDDLAAYLERTGYTRSTDEATRPGRIVLGKGFLEVRPSARSFFAGGNGVRVEFSGRRISRVRPLAGGPPVASAQLEPEVLTNLFDSSREKRRPVSYAELPRLLVDAVLSAEDRRFFDHPGFDSIRVLGAAWVDLRSGAKTQGASTITMQVARTFFFSTRREWSRKAAETFTALLLEQRFSKEKIFELYANQVYLGNRQSFVIRGFGEAAQAYFGKDVRQLTLPQAAFLAGIIRAPNRYSAAERKPERAAEARDRVLGFMVENKVLTPDAAQAARAAPLGLVASATGADSAAYFVDMVRDDLLDRFTEAELAENSYRIYTTLDPGMQNAAADAIRLGAESVDAALARRVKQPPRKRGAPPPPPPPTPAVVPQIALVALDTRTGAIRALSGGRDYGTSQLNRALARRQPGSVFKPFVYGAAFQSGIDGAEPRITPMTTVDDAPTTFMFEHKEYAPNNYGQEFHGLVTLREALTRSLNVATVKVAEQVGYRRVVEFARRAGINGLEPTPAVALGAYEMTPVEVAAAYTVFAGGGMRAEPLYVERVLNAQGAVVESAAPRRKNAIDPRVAYLVTSLLEDVVNRGTGAVVRARGFGAPAGGKTGTSHDGWFAGFTSDLVCVAWVGFDDNRELGLSGSASAAPIWAEFMKRATTKPGYRNPRQFARPEGVVTARVDTETNQLAVEACPQATSELFIAGTEPTDRCSVHGGAPGRLAPFSWLSRIFGGKRKPIEAPPAPPPR